MRFSCHFIYFQPAHSSQLLARGDEILRIDGVDVTKETSVALLIGDDMPGSKVVLFVKKVQPMPITASIASSAFARKY